MVHQTIIRKVGLLQLPGVSFEFLAVLHLDVDVLPFDICCLSTTHVEGRVLTHKTLSNSRLNLIHGSVSASLTGRCEEVRIIHKSLNQM